METMGRDSLEALCVCFDGDHGACRQWPWEGINGAAS